MGVVGRQVNCDLNFYKTKILLMLVHHIIIIIQPSSPLLGAIFFCSVINQCFRGLDHFSLKYTLKCHSNDDSARHTTRWLKTYGGFLCCIENCYKFAFVYRLAVGLKPNSATGILFICSLNSREMGITNPSLLLIKTRCEQWPVSAGLLAAAARAEPPTDPQLLRDATRSRYTSWTALCNS